MKDAIFIVLVVVLLVGCSAQKQEIPQRNTPDIHQDISPSNGETLEDISIPDEAPIIEEWDLEDDLDDLDW